MCTHSGLSTGSSDQGDESVPDSRRRLTAELVVEFANGESVCPVVYDCNSESPIDHHLIDDTCHVTCQAGQSGVYHRQIEIEGECICRILASHGCSPSIQEITDRGLLVRTNPPDRETLRALVADLGDVADTVHLRQLVVSTEEDEKRSELVDLETLTDIERETIDRAIVAGYYDRPRSVDFDDLSDEMGISKSALSKRLTSAEAKIMRDLFNDGE